VLVLIYYVADGVIAEKHCITYVLQHLSSQRC